MVAQGKNVKYMSTVDDACVDIQNYYFETQNIPNQYTVVLADHGAPGEVGMGCGYNEGNGNNDLDATLQFGNPALQEFIQTLDWANNQSEHLSKIIIWECEVAKTSQGRAMLQNIAQQTGVTIVAYDGDTGQTAKIWSTLGISSIHYYVEKGTTQYTFHGSTCDTKVIQ